MNGFDINAAFPDYDLSHKGRVAALAVARTEAGWKIVSSSSNRSVRLSDLAPVRLITSFAGDAGMWCPAATDSGLYAAGSEDGAVHVLERRRRAGTASESAWDHLGSFPPTAIQSDRAMRRQASLVVSGRNCRNLFSAAP